MTIPAIEVYGDSSLNKPGYWDPVTAIIDWCEENYIESFYIAEYWNTLSNIAYFIAFAASLKHYKREDISSFVISFSILSLAIGSGLFHATLKYEAQFLDESPMLLLCVTMFIEGLKNFGYKPKTKNRLITGSIPFIITFLISWMNAFFRSKILFQTTFGAITVLGLYLFVTYNKKAGRSNSNVYKSIVLLSLGFIIWNLDNIFCLQILKIRNNSKILGILFQGHMWWHILTAIGLFYMTKDHYEILSESKKKI